jgi:dienelactone hydrolase
MNTAGFATLEYDSYVARNWENPSRGKGGPKLEAHQTADAYSALKIMQSNPKIDGKRVAIVGTSAGGNTALLAASENLHKRYVGEDGPRFAALVALYPGGYLLPTAADSSVKTPILILPAEKDDFMKWERTKVWVDYVKRENSAIQIDTVLVSEAYHSFMNKSARSGRQFNPDTPVSGTCPFALADFTNPATTYLQLDRTISNKFDPSCQTRGATTGYSSQAAKFAMEQTVLFLKKSFALVN